MSAQAFGDADALFMARAVALAERGLFTATPNPRVGCVIVDDGRIVGEGWHEKAGGPHAEVAALRDAESQRRDVRGATLYVTLEPCNHAGRTPPCTEALVAAGIGRVVAAMPDPNTLAAGGAGRLRAAGIRVDVGLLEREARALNPGFISRVTRGRPYVRMKVAAGLDGRTATADGHSQWITGEAARNDGHAWRARACAILTGIGTVQADNPQLTVRAVATSRQPLRIVVDRHAETPREAKILKGGALIVTAGSRSDTWPDDVGHVSFPDGKGRVDLHAMMRDFAQRELNEIQVEAGARLNGALLEAGLVDEILAYIAPSVLGDPARGIAQFHEARTLDARVALAFESVDRVGDDLRVRARVLPRVLDSRP
jgi:diaminohydroxyphosphoribosylaminopyrimidine deaminase/5-amino-6-(5-phosphoribosylamino)uracil reductase